MRSLRTGFLVRLMLPVLASLLISSFGPARETAQVWNEDPAPLSSLLRMAIPGTHELQLIVELTDPPAIAALAAPAARGAAALAVVGEGRGRINLNSPQAQAYRAQLGSAQKLLITRLNALSGVRVQGTLDLVSNAVIARVPVGQFLAIRRLAGVKKVYFSRPHRMRLDAAAAVHNAPGLWAKAGGRDLAGRGVRVAVADTGIDITNPMFIDSSLTPPAGFPRGEAALTNTKVIVAHNYIHLLSYPQTIQTAVDEVGHGSFVAGCAAGKQVTAPLASISGMAPGAFLGNYKIFGTPGINDFTNTAAILKALDDAVIDGMDVINLSLGSLTYVPPEEDPEVEAIHNAVAAGTVVVIAAGNDGPETHTIGNPGVSPDAITVGAASNSRYFSAQLHVTGPGVVPDNLQNVGYLLGTGPAIGTTISPTQAVDVASLDSSELACSPLPAGSLSGKLAFLKRGDCTFAVKVTHAANAGAIAAIVYNNVTGAPIPMGGLDSAVIPAVMIANASGLDLKAFMAANPLTTISISPSSQILPVAASPGIVADSSSRGPAGDAGLKPDLVAVGEDVYSATQSIFTGSDMWDASHFVVSQGTSFSTAMVSGAAAAIKQLYPGFSPAAIKSALVTTASRMLTTDGTTAAGVLNGGGGMLDMGSASAVGAVFAPSSLSFGSQEYSGTVYLTQEIDITNVSAATDQYSLSVQPLISGPAISFSSTSTGSVPPGGTARISVTIRADAPLTGGFQGFIAVQSAQSAKRYQIPYWAGFYVPDSSRILAVSRDTVPGTYPSLIDALRAARPGNIIEIADSQTYPGGLAIYSNGEGLPLHGITIRAAAGQTPILDGASASAPANLELVGLRNVLLKGLTIRGGATGIFLTRPSMSQPVSITLDHCVIADVSGGSAAAAVDASMGGEIDITYSTISGSTGTGVLVMNGAHLTMSNSTVSGNRLDGIEAYDSNVDLLGSTFSENTDVGAYLVNCSGTLDRNLFSRNTGTYGDGVEIVDGAVTITRNTFDANDRHAIALYSETISGRGPTAVVEDNILQSNGQYGVLSYPALNLRLVGNLIKDNGLGVRVRGTTAALLMNNIIVRSRASKTTTGNGIEAIDQSTVRVVNNTVFRNQLHGIVRSNAASVTVLNTIIGQNTGGDLLGLSSDGVQYSLVGDSLPVGGNNIQGDPQFVNADADDFSLASGSPAIDAGSNAAADLPFLDYNRQLRVAGAGSMPGDGRVDIGALEAGSFFPLVYPLLANGFHPTIGDNYTTGVAALNASSSGIAAGFMAYGTGGTLIPGGNNPTAPRPLAPMAQIAILGYQLFGLVPAAGEFGAVLASSAQPLTGFFLVFDRDFRRLADGVDVSSETATRLVFMRHQFDAAGKSVYVLFNPGVNAATIGATLRDEGGAQVDALPTPIVLAPKESRLLVFDRFAASSGTVQIDSDRPISGLEFFGNTAELAALRMVIPGTEGRLYFPHIALNQGYSSLLGVVNTSNTRAILTLTAYRDDGSALGLPVQRSVNGNGQMLESMSSLFGLSGGPLISGYVVVESDQAGITGFCSFRYDNGLVQSSAAVPGVSIPQQKLLFSHVAHQVPAGTGNYLTGIALLNPFGTPISYTMRVFDGTGLEIARTTGALEPHQKIARILSHPIPGVAFFTQPISLAGGHIEVTTDYQLLGFELFFTEDVSQLAAVVAQPRAEYPGVRR
jgi:hypothetical protein